MYQIFTDSSSDLTTEQRKEHNILYYRMGIVVAGEERFADIDWVDYSPEQLYDWVKDLNNHVKTNLVSVGEFIEKSEPVLKEGKDILYLACADALSGSRNVFEMAKKELLEKYPERKMVSIDTCRAAMCLGLLVLKASELQKEGKTLEEVVDYVDKNKQKYHQVGSVETLSYLKAAGRISGAAAFFGNLIGLKPLVMFDVSGHNYAYKKVNGGKKALAECFEYLKANMVEGVTDVVYVNQAMAKDRQAWLKNKIESELHLKVVEGWIGPIIGVSCGPGMYGLYFVGKEVTEQGETK